MDPAAAAQLAALETYLDHQRNTLDYVFVSAIALLIYEYLLTLDLEINLIWRSRWSYTQLLLDVPPSRCSSVFVTLQWLIMASIVLSEAILLIRTWAVWLRDLKIGILLIIMLATIFALATYCNISLNRSVSYRLSPYQGFRGCISVPTSSILNFDFVALAVVDIIVLALMIASAFRSYEYGSASTLSYVIHRDGIMFYVYLLAATIANLVVMNAASMDLSFSAVPLCTAMYSILASRVIFNIRSNAQIESTEISRELHAYAYEHRHSIPLEFRSFGGTESYSVGIMLSEDV